MYYSMDETMKASEKILFLWMITILAITTFPRVLSTETVLSTMPQHATPFIGEFFTINLTVADVTNLNSWQITLAFNPTILNLTEVIIPPDNVFAGYNIFNPPPIINKTIGRVTKFVALEGTVGVNGSGILCTLRFLGKNLGVTTLKLLNLMQIHMSGTYLMRSDYSLIPFEAKVGVVEVNAPDFHRNIFNVTQNSETLNVVVFTNSTVANFYFNESSKEISFNVIGPDDTTGFSIVTIPKRLLNETLIVIVDNTAIRSFSSMLETLPENATHSFVFFGYSHSEKMIKILLTITGDINGDKKVDIKDLAIVSVAFGSTPESPRWKPVADIDHNNKVDIKDVALVSKSYGKFLQF